MVDSIKRSNFKIQAWAYLGEYDFHCQFSDSENKQLTVKNITDSEKYQLTVKNIIDSEKYHRWEFSL